MVSELIALVGESGNGTIGRSVSAANAPIRNALELATPANRVQHQTMAVSRSTNVAPEQLIPLGDQDFKDF